MKKKFTLQGSSVSLLILGVALLSPLLYVGCNYQVYKGGGAKLKIGDQKPSDVPSFATVNEQVFSKRCQTCHQQKGLFLFDDYSKLTPQLLHDIRDSVLHQGNVSPMPKAPEPPLTEQELSLLVGWINAGAPKEKPLPGESPSPTPLPATPTPVPSTPIPEPVYVPGEPLPSFTQLKTFVLDKKCIGCHDPSDDLDLSDYAVFAGKAEVIRARVLLPLEVKGHMPPTRSKAGQLSWDELSALVKFIDGGKPENGTGNWQPPVTATPGPTPTPAPTNSLAPNFASIKAKIFDAKCIGCHTPPKFAGKLYPLVNLAGLLAADSGLTKKDTVNSRLMSAVTRTDDGRMPPEGRGEPLTQDEVEILKQWISLGCPE